MKNRKVYIRLVEKVLRIISMIVNVIPMFAMSQRCVLLKGAKLYPCATINNGQYRESIKIGKNSQILGKLETMGHGGSIVIGDNCFVGEGTRIWSAQSIVVGSNVLISHNVNIHDTNSHSNSAIERSFHFRKIFTTGHPETLPGVNSVPIAIEDNVWIGFNAVILKGVTIGEGSIVGANTLVTKSVEPWSIVAGNPMKVIGNAKP